MSKYCIRSGFFDTDRQVATVAMETTQLVLSQFKNFLTHWTENLIRSLCTKYLVNVVNWWSYVILIVAVRTQCSYNGRRIGTLMWSTVCNVRLSNLLISSCRDMTMKQTTDDGKRRIWPRKRASIINRTVFMDACMSYVFARRRSRIHDSSV